MIEVAPLDITRMLAVNEQGIPFAPNIRQIQDKDVRELYIRDKTPTKSRYIQEVGVIYYVADPKSPPNQMGYSRPEALVVAKSNYGLDANWEPDELINRIIDEYKKGWTPAEEALNSASHALHNANLAANFISEQLSIKMHGGLKDEDTLVVIDYINKLSTIINLLPNQLKTLNEAKQAVMLDNQQRKARGGKTITTSMLATDAADIEAQAEAERAKLGLAQTNTRSSFTGEVQTYELTK
jgi:hypothetical protein